MKKQTHHHRDDVFDQDDEPSGGRVKMWLVGVGVALLPTIYGVYCLVTGHAILPAERGSDLDVYGDAAIALGITYMAVGLFIHAQWFWGLHPRFSFLRLPLLGIASLAIVVSLVIAIFKILA